MQYLYLLTMAYFFNVVILLVFFIFITAVAVYLKIFIKKKSKYKEFIVSKYIGGISRQQLKSIRSFYIFYDFFMLLLLSIMIYLIPSVVMFNLNDPYKIVILFLLLILILTIAVPLDNLVAITRFKWIGSSGSPKGMIMVWERGNVFGDIYNYIIKFFWRILLLAMFVSFVLAMVSVLIIKI